MSLFKTAQRTQAKLRLAIDGPSGSGKTYSALLIAKGLAGGDLAKVALIDTERGSGSLYADLGSYAVAEMHPPYLVAKYVAALDAAAAEGFEVIVVDSMTHAWSGEGGVLDYVDAVAKAQTRGNSFAAWKEGTPLQQKLIDTVLASPCHVIVTMRSKTEWVLEENEKGKKQPRKIGLAPDQRKDVDYEFTLVLDLSREHIATASKDRTGLFDARLEVPSEAMGRELAEWLGSATPEPPRPPAEEAPAPAGGNGGNGRARADQQREQQAVREAVAVAIGTEGFEKLVARAEALGFTAEQVIAKARAMGHEGTGPQMPREFGVRIWTAMSEAAGAAAEPTATPPGPSAVPEAPAGPPGGQDEAMPPGMDAEQAKEYFAAQATPNAGKKGSVTGPQITRIAAQCGELEGLGVTETEWRLFLADAFGITSRTELMKSTSAPKAIDALQKWITDLKTGIAVAGEGRAA